MKSYEIKILTILSYRRETYMLSLSIVTTIHLQNLPQMQFFFVKNFSAML